MSVRTKVPLSQLIRPIERAEAPVPGKLYRQIGVKLWGAGAYERESIDGAETRYSRLFAAATNDVIVNKIWARNGSAAVVPASLEGCYGSGEFPMFSPDLTKLHPRWMHWLTKTRGFWAQCDEKSRGTSGKNRIRPERFLEIEIPLPPLPEQQRLVARIETLADQLHEAQALRRSASAEAETLSRATIETVYGRLASQFGTSQLADACATITDGDHNTPPFGETGIRFIFVGNVSSGLLHFRDSKRVTEEYFKTLRPQRLPRRGDLLYSAVGATLGIPAVVDSDEPFCFQRHIAILKPNPKRLDSRFGWYMLRSRTVFDRAWSATTGSAQPTIPLRAIRELPLPLPPLVEQRRIIGELDCLQGELERLRSLQVETTTEIDAMLPSVLSKAFAGEL
jgi:type I restriction enzyme S subunit